MSPRLRVTNKRIRRNHPFATASLYAIVEINERLFVNSKKGGTAGLTRPLKLCKGRVFCLPQYRREYANKIKG